MSVAVSVAVASDPRRSSPQVRIRSASWLLFPLYRGTTPTPTDLT
jgi:hypothetical protein